MRPISGNQALSPFQGSGTGGDFIASGGLQSGGLTLSGGQPYRANLAGLQGHTPGLLPPMGAPPYPGLAGPPLPSPMTSTTDAFQVGFEKLVLHVYLFLYFLEAFNWPS